MKKFLTTTIFVLAFSLLTSCGSTTTANTNEYVFPVGYWNILDYIATDGEYFNEEGKLIEENIALGDYPFVLKEDNSVTYTIEPKEVVTDMLSQLEGQMNEYAEYVKTNYSTIQDVEINDDYTEFDFYVDDNFSYALFTDFDSFMINSICYQLYKQVPEDKLTATITIHNNETKKVINTFTYENFFIDVSFPSYLEQSLASDFTLFDEYSIDYKITEESINITLPRTFSLFLGELYKYQLDNPKATITSIMDLQGISSVEVNDTYTEVNFSVDEASLTETMAIAYPTMYSAIYGYYTYNELSLDESKITFNVYNSATDALIESSTLENLSPKIQALSSATVN